MARAAGPLALLLSLLAACTQVDKAKAPGEVPPVASGAEADAFKRVVEGEAHKAAVLAAAERQNAGMPGGCEGMRFAPQDDFVFLEQLRFDADGRLQAGAWLERVTGNGCGGSRQFNVATAAQGGDVRRATLFPGTTRADFELQRNSLRQVAAGAAVAVPGCTPALLAGLRVVDTFFVSFTGPLDLPRERQPWAEIWLVAACGRFVELPIRFAPEGGEIVVEVLPREARLH